MTPLIKKTLFRLKELRRPFASERSKRNKALAQGSTRAFTAIITILIAAGVVFSSRLPVRFLFNEGDIASEDIYAPFDFSYRAGIDEARTSALLQAAESAVNEVYNLDADIAQNAKKAMQLFLSVIKEIKSFPVPDETGREVRESLLIQLNEAVNPALSSEDFDFLLNMDDISVIESGLDKAIDNIYTRPIISDDDLARLLSSGAAILSLYEPSSKKKSDINISDIDTIAGALERAQESAAEFGISDKKEKALVFKLISAWAYPNLIFNKNETDSARLKARASVEAVYLKAECLKGEAIIRKGQKINRTHVIQFDAISSKIAPEEAYFQLFGIAVIIALMLFSMFVFVKIFEKRIYAQEKMLVLIGLFIILTAASARGMATSPLPSLFLPIASVPMLLTLLAGGTVSIAVLIVISAIAALVAGIQFDVFLVSLIGGITAICTVHNARSRTHIIRSGALVGAMNFIVISAIGVMFTFEANVFLRQALWGMASGIVSAAITMIFLPVFEFIFKITTNIKLLELADLNHPLLKKMVTTATGTYHHSIIVGNLAEAAAEAIGANSLLCRIGAYYHDIGKIEKAEYFAENVQVPAESHEGLSPSMSSLVITNHVKDGDELAEKYKLGSAIKDIIKQHHGTGLMTFFYHQALEKKKKDEEVNEESFRYPGPRPQSRESAIVMLADSVEAASRLVEDPTPQKLKELVRKIINNKFLDHQLDECDLSLKDISRISESFVKILTGTYHSRIKYPDMKTGQA
ncbi:MAG: HDIG domain-containing protein [Candidatus Omnitrophica bacterium]|nr:HDIG domain-containing protein [Candidatus Omnitrophota bacterium]